MKKLLTFLFVVMIAPTVMLLTACNNPDKTIETNIYLGEHQIVKEGTQKSLDFPNISYEYSTNTLTILPSVFKYSYCGAKSYDGIYLGGQENIGKVSFLFTYSGTKDLNIVLYGDNKFINDCDVSSTIVGGIYIEKGAKVNIKGPGLIFTTNLTHSVLYGKEAFVNFEDVSVESSNNTCSFGIACDQASFVDCDIDVEVTDYGYSGLYIPNGTYDTRTHFNSVGFDYGYYVGSTFMYDGCVLESHNTKEIAANFYALEAYDSTLKLSSDSCGISCYDGATFNNCEGFVYSDCLYGFNSLEATLVFNNCDFDVSVNEGIGIQAWRNFFFDSTIKVVSIDGIGINSEYNVNVGEADHPGVYIYNSYITAEGSDVAIYSTADLEIEGSVLTSDQKILGKLVEMFDNNIMKAICEKTETELILTSGEEGQRIYPTNAAKKVVIEKADK